MTTGKITVTAYVTEAEYEMLKRIQSVERRSISSTIATMILKEASQRGMLSRAPEAVPTGNTARKP